MSSTELLRRFPLFSNLDFYTLDEIALISDEIILGKDEWIFHEKDDATKLYLILEGKVALTMYLFIGGVADHMQMDESFGKGEIIGWSALVKPYAYTLGARTQEETHLLEIQAEPLRQLLDDNPESGYHMMKYLTEVISERLVYKCIQLLSLVLDDEENSRGRNVS